MPSIVLVTVWMGPLPSYLPLFLGSCRANPSVRFLIPSDQPAPAGLPPNVRWLPLTLDGFNRRATERLGTPVRVERGYKLCDFKPTYGVVFADEIGDADFWGACDVDLIWGNIRSFLREDVLAGGDLFTFRGPGWLSGALTVYRTRSEATRLYARAPGWRHTLADPGYQGFDETCGRWDGHERAVADLVARGERVSLTDVAREAERAGELRLHVGNELAEPNRAFSLQYRCGVLTETTGEPGERIGSTSST